MMNTCYQSFANKQVNKQHGVALIASLLIMLLMTIIALSVFRGNNLMEKIAGNTREKQRALQSAQNALIYGEYWLNTASAALLTPVAATACVGAAITTLQVCPSTNLATASNMSTLALYKYSSPGVTFASTPTAGGLANATPLSDIKYSQQPAIYIAYLGTLSGTTSPIYQVTAIGYGGNGGNNGTVAIVQSVYKPGGGGGGSPTPPVLSGL